ncbi:MAG: aminotransferase class V-fold PLP-dependent enzyme, partial [Chloroflexota bacterium]|nr:aminotransferase class V-fold PLP-dependent enzyme [Chloroflexota bacterium]
HLSRALGRSFAPGDEIIAGSLENPAALVPLMLIAERKGLTLRWADMGNGEKDSAEAVAAQITPRTRMALISDTCFATGARVDLRAIADVVHDAGALLIADGIQTAGASPIDVEALGVDGYALARHKFLCGPDGAGALYVNRAVFDRVLPTYAGVFTDAEHGMSGALALMPTAQRYEVSTRPIPVIMGGTAALRWLADEVGWPFVFERMTALYDRLWRDLGAIPGVRVLSPSGGSGLLTIAVEGMAPADVVAGLRERNIFTRTIVVTEPQGVRLSIGAWNRESDLDAIAEAVEALAQEGRG